MLIGSKKYCVFKNKSYKPSAYKIDHNVSKSPNTLLPVFPSQTLSFPFSSIGQRTIKYSKNKSIVITIYDIMTNALVLRCILTHCRLKKKIPTPA